jgi:hypothetical protein
MWRDLANRVTPQVQSCWATPVLASAPIVKRLWLSDNDAAMIIAEPTKGNPNHV